jgi:hypothetical protein
MAPKTIDLELQTLWFAKLQPHFPTQKMRDLGDITANCSWEYWPNTQVGDDYEFICALQFLEDMSIVKIKLKWNTSNPRGTVKAEQKHVLGPPPLTDEQLELAQEWYGKHIVDLCTSRVGTTVGDGECWSLANETLKNMELLMIRQGLEPPIASRGKVHGQCILEYDPAEKVPTEGLLEMVKVNPGDILQMENGYFRAIRHHRVFNLRSEETHTAQRTHGNYHRGTRR